MFSLGSGVQCAKFSILSRASAALDTSATRLSARCVGVLSVALKEKTNLWLAVALMLLAFALTRLPDLLPLNFSAAYALAFCAGAYFPRYLAWGLPLGVMLVTDSLLNVYYYHVPAVGAYMLTSYLAYAAIIWLGRRFTAKSSWLKLTGGGLLGAILFYLVTNTVSWWQNPAYAKTVAGWIQALTIGEPGYPPTWTFFRNSLLSGGLFTGLFAGAMKLSERKEAEKEEAEAEPEKEPEDARAEESGA